MAEQPNHVPPSPGEVLRSRVLKDMNITQDRLAEALGVSRFSVNQVLNARRSVTPDMALRLERVLGTSAELWLGLQSRFDLHVTRQKIGRVVAELPQLRPPQPLPEFAS